MSMTMRSLWVRRRGEKDDMTAEALRTLYTVDHDRCALCWIPEEKTRAYRWPHGLQLAHILGGPMRVNQPWNVLMLCETCHRAHHNSNVFCQDDTKWHNVTTELLLAVKRELDELNVPMLATLWGRMPDYVEGLASTTTIPEFFLQQREQWRGF